MAARAALALSLFETAAPGEHVTRPPRKRSPARRRTGAKAAIRSRRSELGGREARDRSSSVGDWSTVGSQGAPISSLIPVRRETWGAARFRRGLEAPAPTGQATRSARRPRRAPGSSRRQRTGPPARPRGTSANGSGKAMPPSRGSWRGGRRERFASSFTMAKAIPVGAIATLSMSPCPRYSSEWRSCHPSAWSVSSAARTAFSERAPTRLRPARRSQRRVCSTRAIVTRTSAPASAGASAPRAMIASAPAAIAVAPLAAARRSRRYCWRRGKLDRAIGEKLARAADEPSSRRRVCGRYLAVST